MNMKINEGALPIKEPDILLDGDKIEDFPILQEEEEYEKYLMAEYQRLQETFEKLFQELKS